MIDFTDSIYEAQQGSQSAVKYIYDNTIQLFGKEANVFLKDKNAADSAILDAYVFIFNHLDSLEDTSKFLLWANEVCKNTCIESLLEQGVFDYKVPQEAANIGEILPSSDYDTLINNNAHLAPQHIQDSLEAILDSLPDNQRVCAVLWGEGYPINSISRKLGMSHAAVNYTLAYALGNITNSVNALGENGLPLFSMDPIPYFLWLLINYYQLCQQDGPDPCIESSFSNVLRHLLPDEASIYSSGSFDAEETYDSEGSYADDDGRIKHFSDPSDEFDLESFINKSGKESETGKEPVEPEKDSESETSEAAPLMDVFEAHKDPLADDHSDSPEDEASADEKSLNEGSDPQKDSSETASSETASPEKTEAEPDDSSSSDESKESLSEDELLAGSIVAEAMDGIKDPEPSAPFNNESEKPAKKRKGLIILLTCLLLIACLIAAGFIFYGDTVKATINKIAGTQIFSVPQNSPDGPYEDPSAAAPEPEGEPETEAPSTEAPTTEAPTTEEPTTEALAEPETEPDLPLGSPYNVTIYADGDDLAMKDAPNGNNILYIPSDTEVSLSETENGWGHTSYDGYDGWIWLGYTKVSGKAPVYRPEADSILETPETFVANEGTNLYPEPQAFSSTFGPVLEGSPLSIEALYYNDYNGETWGYTSYDGNTGWVFMY